MIFLDRFCIQFNAIVVHQCFQLHLGELLDLRKWILGRGLLLAIWTVALRRGAFPSRLVPLNVLREPSKAPFLREVIGKEADEVEVGDCGGPDEGAEEGHERSRMLSAATSTGGLHSLIQVEPEKGGPLQN